ncbi:MAG: type II toxin-antitoxin system RelE/ParE family toxin [Pirellulales bacterium]
MVWTESAQAHLAAIHAYISRDSPRYAQAMIDRITRRAEQCRDWPLAGARVPEYDQDEIREVLQHPYRIIYRVRPTHVEIVAVVHGARLLPPDAPQ